MVIDDPNRSEPALVEAIDALLAPVFTPDAPGVAVLVARHGQILFRRAYGLAHLELGVPLAPEMVFRVGSITKQFTAVAILLLAEQGRLSLDDPITAYLPDFPTHGHQITIEHLLTHTSGIRSYTGIPELRSRFCQAVSVAEVIAILTEQTREFAPGERWAYNNSAYFLLGAIIERLSGLTYGDFLQQRIVGPLGMSQTAYEPSSRIIPRHVAGYAKEADGYHYAPPFSMTWAYAAGGLTSSVDDLLGWDEALYGDGLLSGATLERAFTSATLTNGDAIDYGHGWRLGRYAGQRTVEHSGGINGFLSHALRLPDEHVFVAVLMNMNGPGIQLPPEQVAVKAAGLVIGQPYQPPVAVSLATASLDAYVGAYQSAITGNYRIARHDDHLVLQRAEREPEALWPLAADDFFIPDSSTSFAQRVAFTRASDGRVTGFTLRGRFRPFIVAMQMIED